MVYYDEACAALKAFAKDVIQGIMMVYLEDGTTE